MNSRQRLSVAFGIVFLSAALSVLAAPSLPDQLAIHWNAAGEPDGTMAQGPALALFPALAGAVVTLLAIVPRIDPLADNIAAFRPTYDWFVVAFAGFLAVVHAGVVAFNHGYEFDFTLLVVAGVAILYYLVGIVLDRAERNWFVGVRTPWTLESDEVWDRTHALASRLFKLTAAIAAVGLAFPDVAVYFLLVPTLATGGIAVGYSYYCYERLDGVETTDGSESNPRTP